MWCNSLRGAGGSRGQSGDQRAQQQLLLVPRSGGGREGQVGKGIILACGAGTRQHPLAKAFVVGREFACAESEGVDGQ